MTRAPKVAPEAAPKVAPKVDGQQHLRRTIYALLIAIAVGQMVGRILAVNSVNQAALSNQRINEGLKTFQEEQLASGADAATVEERIVRKRIELTDQLSLERPFLSANDRSRWLTVRSLVEAGTYQVDDFFRLPRWDSIDMVSHLGRDGERHYYSSKPPLLATILAGKYWVIQKITGWTFATHPYELVRLILLLTNVPLMIVFFLVVAALAEQLGTTDWGRLFTVATATMGTLITPFAVTLNNHTFGVASTALAIYLLVQIVRSSNPRGWQFAGCGLAAAFAVTNELPAAALLAMLGLLLLWHDWKKTLLWGVPAVLVVAAAYFGTNYIAHDSLNPPYTHRSDSDPVDDWYTYSYEKDGKTVQSYWQNRQGIDIGEPLILDYAFHVMIGHHGVFSLTPVWILSVCGMAMWLVRGKPLERELALIAVALTLACLVFFIALRPQDDRNYGGLCSGFRWVYWLIPLWVVTMIPMLDRMANSRVARGVALVLLALSMISVSYPTWNPWTHPWLYDALVHFGPISG